MVGVTVTVVVAGLVVVAHGVATARRGKTAREANLVNIILDNEEALVD